MTNPLPFAAARYDAGGMLELRRLFPSDGARVLLKLECLGPTGSSKDRAAESLFAAARRLGLVTARTRIVEASSGAFGVALARLSAAHGVKATIVAPETIPPDRREQLRRFGAELVLTPSSRGMTGAVQEAIAIANADANAWRPNLFENPANPSAYETGTALEIWRATNGVVAAFVCGVGSGGAFVGVSRFLRRMNGSIERIAVEPSDAAALSGGGRVGSSSIAGLGAGFVPPLFDRNLPTSIATATLEEASEWRARAARLEGLTVGLSTGANLAVVGRLASQRAYYGKTLVTLAFSRE